MGKFIRLLQVCCVVFHAVSRTEVAACSEYDHIACIKNNDLIQSWLKMKKPANLSQFQFKPLMSYCLYLTVINIISDAFLHNSLLLLDS